MNNIINKPTVLVLNRHWQAIHVKTPAEAFCMMASDAGTALDIADGNFLPTKWSDWLKLAVREHDTAVNTPRGQVRVPTVIVAANYTRVPLRRPRFGARGIWERDGGVCQYTGRKLSSKEGNIDHVVPRSRGGKTSWENCVLAHREINTRKADRLPQEAGLRLNKRPIAPRALPASAFIRNYHGVQDWEHFLARPPRRV
jgi:5-methylcytosine-specific restriction endonuclease McrA